MLEMKELTFDMPVQIKTSPRAKAAFDRIVGNLRASERVRWKDRRVTKEAVFSAVWLWLADQPETTVEAIFGEYLPRLEALMSDEPMPDRRPGLSGGEDLSRPEEPGSREQPRRRGKGS